MTSNLLNLFILKYLKALELTGVLMRIGSFSLVSWLGPQSTLAGWFSSPNTPNGPNRNSHDAHTGQ